MDAAKFIPYLAIVIAAYSFVVTHFKTKGAAVLESDVNLLKKQMELFWSIVEKKMGNELHSPHTPDLDKLLDKTKHGERLTQEEAVELCMLLQKLMDSDDLSTGEKSSAIMLMAVTMAKYSIGIES